MTSPLALCPHYQAMESVTRHAHGCRLSPKGLRVPH